MLTPTQHKVYQIVKNYIETHGYAPTLREIGQALGISEKSQSMIKRCLDHLNAEGLVKVTSNISRGIELNTLPMYQIPLRGRIAAGMPIEAIETNEVLDLESLLDGGNLFALEVKGESMIDEGILDGDKVICRQQNTAREGDIVVALINQQDATLKRISYKTKGKITLLPANSTLQPQVYPKESVEIQGVFIGLWRFHS